MKAIDRSGAGCPARRRRAVLLGLAGLYIGPAFALYDPKPDEALAVAQGEWRGTLTYRDYRDPARIVTLPTRLFVALGAPSELVLHYVFDDGPSKTVYSYERMAFDFARRQIRWVTGDAAKVSDFTVVSDVVRDAARTIVFERTVDDRVERFTLVVSAAGLMLGKEEVGPDGVASFRNRFEFVRPALRGPGGPA